MLSWQRRQASAASRGIALVEAEDQPRFAALGLQVAAGRPMTAFAGVAAMHVFGERFRIFPVAVRAEVVVVDVFGAGNRGNLSLDFLVRDLGEEIVCPGETGIEFGLSPARRRMRGSTGYPRRHQHPQAYGRQERNPDRGRLACFSTHSFTSLRKPTRLWSDDDPAKVAEPRLRSSVNFLLSRWVSSHLSRVALRYWTPKYQWYINE